MQKKDIIRSKWEKRFYNGDESLISHTHGIYNYLISRTFLILKHKTIWYFIHDSGSYMDDFVIILYSRRLIEVYIHNERKRYITQVKHLHKCEFLGL